MLTDSPKLQFRWVRVAPHIVDTLLLASAITLAFQMHLSTLEQPWLMVKIVALLAYIGIGTIALKPGRSKKIRVLAWLLAIATFTYIVSVALTKSVMGWLGSTAIV